jgi:hypothetical protein
MITIPADDLQEFVVGSLGEYKAKLRKANDPAAHAAELRRPRTLREVLGLEPGLTMWQAFGPNPA